MIVFYVQKNGFAQNTQDKKAKSTQAQVRRWIAFGIVLDGMVSDFKPITHFFPRSITTIEKFDSDNRENQFLDFLDVEVDKWFAEKEGYTDKEYITVVSEDL